MMAMMRGACRGVALASLALALAIAIATAGCGSVARCEIGQTACGDACVDVLNDNAHCGRCDNPCDSGLICGNGACAAGCPIDQMECSGTCVDVLTDEDHCGTCNMPCAADEECQNGSCEIPCAMQLDSPIVDPWGMTWDGLERTAAALDAATIECGARGGRLPTATELYRVSANQSGAVGMSFHTNPLWSMVPADRLEQIAIRLSDGVASNAPAATPITYRCVCAPPEPPFFSGPRCNGPAAAPCFELGPYHVDVADRPALRKSAAIWECAREHAHVIDTTTLIEAIQSGLPGSGAPLMTADRAQHDQSSTIAWTSGAWIANGNIAAVAVTTQAPFRCAGPRFAAGTHPNPIADEFVGPSGGGYKSETVELARAGWIASFDACAARGGHVPRSSELAELIMLGLPNGTGEWMWTSDQCGYNGSQFLVAALRWTGLDQRFPYEYGGGASTLDWTYKHSGMNATRCIYYPLDPAFVAPSVCNGGCFTVTLPSGAMPAVIVLDSADRAAVAPEVAFDTCRQAGGHLASERDLMEAIRAGLPGGAAPEYVWTSEVVRSSRLNIVRWTAIDTGFTDLYATYMSWGTLNATYPFRCIWTNEIR
jgi:hypothetical protein